MLKGFFLPTRYFMTCGFGRGNSELVAFDDALISAGANVPNGVFFYTTTGVYVEWPGEYL